MHYKPRNILTSQPPRSKFALSVAERIEAATPLTDDIVYLLIIRVYYYCYAKTMLTAKKVVVRPLCTSSGGREE